MPQVTDYPWAAIKLPFTNTNVIEWIFEQNVSFVCVYVCVIKFQVNCF